MKIHLRFDEDLLLKRTKRNQPLLFGIAWENDGIYYPSDRWIDFGAIIIGWWFYIAAKDPQKLIESKLQFMDGPYSIKVSFDDQENNLKFEPEGIDVIWQTSIEEFRKELVFAATKIADKLSELDIDMESQITLKKAIYLLKSATE